jgi:hypothetical protein
MNQSTKSNTIGFCQRIQLDWLEKTAQMVLDGIPPTTIRQNLDTFLSDRLSVGNTKKSGNRQLTISILMRIWSSVPPELENLRDRGLALLQKLPVESHLAIHWGMAIAVYPFFGAVAEAVGRLTKLQNNIIATQVQSRLRDRYGDRETVTRATRRILRCFIDWQVLQDTDKLGIYQSITPIIISDQQITAWLLEAVLISTQNNSGQLNTITRSPLLFPFTLIAPTAFDLQRSNYLEISHQGLREEVIALSRRSFITVDR